MIATYGATCAPIGWNAVHLLTLLPMNSISHTEAFAMPQSTGPRMRGRMPSGEGPRPSASASIEPPTHSLRADRLALALEIQQRHQAGRLRIKEDHALVLLTMRYLHPKAVDVSALYKTLLEESHVVPLSRLYRILKVLEEIEMVQRYWEPNQGRPRSVYGLTETALDGRYAAPPVCAHCGAPLARHAEADDGSV